MKCCCRPVTLSHWARITPHSTRRWISTGSASWDNALARPVQAYISASRDPYLNLSIEHDILTKSAKHSVVLFIYINRPSVIIGRNQNPWLEVNLPLLNQGRNRLETEPPGLGVVDLVRRRSGGGTVFHDEGNVNWTVICPKDQFTRDRHAEMVVRALRSRGVNRARVNERHDIVLDQGEWSGSADPEDTHTSPYMNSDSEMPRPLKVSGSAYKITGSHRALHHGTCLLSSPNLNIIPDYLHSPAKPFIKEARGVPSVSSPVGNILLHTKVFCVAVFEAYSDMYPSNEELSLEQIGEDWLKFKTIKDGVEELKSLKHTYEQTPRFIVSNESDSSAQWTLELNIREGKVVGGSLLDRSSDAEASQFTMGNEPASPKLHELDWDDALHQPLSGLITAERQKLLAWLRSIFPNRSK